MLGTIIVAHIIGTYVCMLGVQSITNSTFGNISTYIEYVQYLIFQHINTFCTKIPSPGDSEYIRVIFTYIM